MEKKLNSKGKITESTRLILVLVILLGIAGTFILILSWPLLTGNTIVLDTQPVDPFDVLRGQYITIRYDISNIPVIEGVNSGDNIYVILEKDAKGIHRYKSSSIFRPENDVIFIKGNVKGVYGSNMGVEYGIEQFFFERDATFSTRDMTVEAKVSKSGQARISKVLVDGKPIEIKYKQVKFTS